MIDFDCRAGSVFRFTECSFDPECATARLGYALEDDQGRRVDLQETITFPPPETPLPRARAEAMRAAVRLLHLIAGMSYYKAAIPRRIVIDGPPIDEGTANFLRELYLNGLSEFAYRNGLDLADRLVFPAAGDPPPPPPRLDPADRPLVALGGGKDSIVCLEALRGHDPVAAVVGDRPLIERVATASGLPLLRISRRLAPELLQLNQQGAYNGHVAITAIVCSILVAAAILGDHDAVVLANERSADEGNLVRVGSLEVNHQYSKSLDFETRFRDILRADVATGLDCFSLLRPLSELAICRHFAHLERYHGVFSSCNANFRITAGRPQSIWCCECPKCHFVFLALAPFLAAGHLTEIFGTNLLDREASIPLYEELLAVSGAPKPFECVGAVDEARAAFIMLSRSESYRDTAAVRRFASRHLERISDPDHLVARALEAAGEHLVPPRYREVVDALC